jgi:multicomponent Na+:H+ antiporter subunit F
MTTVHLIAGVLFGLGALGAGYRLLRGPGALDRAIALDVLLTIVVGVTVLLAAVNRSATTLVIGVVVAVLGFLGSAAVAKLLPADRL